jgi:hypothetical protein
MKKSDIIKMGFLIVLLYGAINKIMDFDTIINLTILIIASFSIYLFQYKTEKRFTKIVKRIFLSLLIAVGLYYYLELVLDLLPHDLIGLIGLICYCIGLVVALVVFHKFYFKEVYSDIKKLKLFNLAFVLIALYVLLVYNLFPINESLIRKMKGRITGEYIGFVAEESEAYKSYKKLNSQASKEELVELLEHSDPAVRCWAFMGLTTRENVDIYEILSKNLHHTEEVRTQYFDMLGSQKASDIMLEYGLPMISEAERDKIDSIIIFNNLRLGYSAYLFESLKPKDSYYNKIKELVISNNFPHSIIGLSKFQRIEDSTYIFSWLNEKDTEKQKIGLKAVKNFPDPVFFDKLKDIYAVEISKPTGFDYGLIRGLYSAFVQYKTNDTRELLLQTLDSALYLDNTDISSFFEDTLDSSLNLQSNNVAGGSLSTLEYHSQYIWVALSLYPDTIFTGVKERINISDFMKDNFKRWYKIE